MAEHSRLVADLRMAGAAAVAVAVAEPAFIKFDLLEGTTTCDQIRTTTRILVAVEAKDVSAEPQRVMHVQASSWEGWGGAETEWHSKSSWP